MSVTQSPLEKNRPEIRHCSRCNIELPPYATFCGNCGERVPENLQEQATIHHADIAERYRITSLARRYHHVQLFFAIDTQAQLPVVISDIDLSSLDEQDRTRAEEAFQEECSLLQHLHMPAVMQVLELYSFNNHIYLIAGWPSNPKKEHQRKAHPNRLITLQDFLQSGIGLPNEQDATAWIYRLSRTLESLHKNKRIIGNIDPQMIIVDDYEYTTEPVIMISWLPELLQELLPEPSNNTKGTSFYAPEALSGATEACSDIYSLGAIFYLLLTGTPPDDANTRTHRPLRSVHEIDPELNNNISAVVMQALALDKSERYATASAFSEALRNLLLHTDNPQPAPSPTRQTPGQTTETPKDSTNEEINISSPQTDNKTDTQNESQPGKEQEDATISIVPLQAQMARRYLSRIQTSKLEDAEKENGEAPVEGQKTKHANSNEQAKMKQPGNAALEDHIEETSAEQTATSTESEQKQEYMATTETKAANAPEHTESEQPIHKVDNPHNETVEQAQSEAAQIHEKRQSPVGDIADRPTQLVSKDILADEITQQKTISLPHDETVKKESKPQEQVEKATTSGNKPVPLKENSLSLERFKGMISGSFPAISRLHVHTHKHSSTQHPQSAGEKGETSLLRRMRRFILGEQQQNTGAAALIETPMRIQPNQSYSIRINIIGRSTPKSEQTGGLSALVEGEKVHIEVRSALYQNYAYVVQQTDVTIPATSFVAEVTMPMQPLASGPSGRRERLHIFFMDDMHNPLYEKPFVIEIFVSHLVQNGREGHNVLSIPL